MKNLFHIIVCLFLFLQFSCKSQKEVSPANNIEIASIASITNTLDFLTQDEAKGRETGTKELQVVAEKLENIFRENNIKPYFKTYKDTLSNTDWPAYNIVGYVPGNDVALKNEFVVIGAHYDHIGIIEELNGDNIANGANDNAVGTAAVMEVAKYFGNNKTNKRSLLLVLFTAEEKGLIGSKHLAEKLKKQNMDLYFMFNFEMIGVPMAQTEMLYYITGFSKSNMAKKMNEYAGFNITGYNQIESKYRLFGRSDNFPFYQEFNIPAQTISTFDFKNYNYYHHVDDEMDKLNIPHIQNVINKTIPVLEKMINATTKEIKLNE
jgi:Zn-dependent M28 family amino/carboxypeptidase